MTEHIAPVFMGVGPELLTTMLAALPVTELRGSIPWATFVLKLNWIDALLWSILGNIVPVPLILLLLDPLEKWLGRWPIFRKLFDWLFARTRKKGRMIARYKAVGLTLFVAIPLPITGAWTGSIAARLFGIRFLPALVCISLGVCIAGTIITLACQGFIGFWDLSRQFTTNGV